MAKGLYKMSSPFKIVQFAMANPMVAAGLAQGAIGFFGGRAARRRAQRERSLAMDAMRKSRQAYLDQEITNPYANLENPYEDLTVNQQQAQFQAQQGAQARADILGGLRGAAGGSGAAALAQSLANQQTRQQQAMSASIGQQEAANQRARAQGAASIQRLEAAGEAQRQQQEMARTQNLFGIDMARVTAANQAVSDARAQQSAGLGQMVGAGIMGAASGAFNPAQTTLAPGGGNLQFPNLYQGGVGGSELQFPNLYQGQNTIGTIGNRYRINQNLMNYTPGSIFSGN